MQTRTVIDKIEIEPQTGNVGLRMLKQVVDDDGAVLASQYHRTMIAPNTDPAAQMAAVNAHLGAMGYPAVKTEDHGVLNTALASVADLRAAKAQEAASVEAVK